MGTVAWQSCITPPDPTISDYLSGVDFRLNAVPSGSCPSGSADDKTIKVRSRFYLAESEFTNTAAAGVLQWALEQGRITESAGSHNTADEEAVYFGGQVLVHLAGPHSQIVFRNGAFSVQPGLENHPLIEVSWFGAVMLCNWMTEMSDGHAENLVYSGMSESWEDDDTVAALEKRGYRLPSTAEWELAARYIDGNTWLPGNHASGDTAGSCDVRTPTTDGLPPSPGFGRYGWYEGNSDAPGSSGISPPKGTHPVGTAGSGSSEPLSGTSNFLGLYDMSGNVWEWCFDDYHHMRLIKGGSWWTTAAYMKVGHQENFRPTYSGTLVGFRVARSY